MRVGVFEAFKVVRDGCSPDRVVVDPDLNRRFLEVCRSKGLQNEPSRLNRALLNLRKAGHLAGLPKSCRTSFGSGDDYRFASEIAVRFLERRDGVTLDDVICDPALAAKFDEIAARIAPGHTPLEYRWAALNLRKRKKLRPERVSHAVPSAEVVLTDLAIVELATLSSNPGLYVFFNARNVLYVGETKCLRRRIAKHLEHSDNKGLARWLWDHDSEPAHLELHILPDGTPTRVRRALESELIASRRPEFNVKGT